MRKWEVIRSKKWKYILLHGVVYWGILVGILRYFFKVRFRFSNFIWTDFLISIATSAVIGLAMGYWFYRSNETRFREVRGPNQAASRT